MTPSMIRSVCAGVLSLVVGTKFSSPIDSCVSALRGQGVRGAGSASWPASGTLRRAEGATPPRLPTPSRVPSAVTLPHSQGEASHAKRRFQGMAHRTATRRTVFETRRPAALVRTLGSLLSDTSSGFAVSFDCSLASSVPASLLLAQPMENLPCNPRNEAYEMRAKPLSNEAARCRKHANPHRFEVRLAHCERGRGRARRGMRKWLHLDVVTDSATGR